MTIINDILDFSKIEAGRLEFERVPTDLRVLLDGVSKTLAPNAERGNVALELAVDDTVPALVQVDPVRLRQVLFNLTGNAVKFSRDGRVQVAVKWRQADERLEVRVADTGIGMSAEQLARLFTPFMQAETSTTRRFGGTGLGLTICHRLVELAGGEISVTSEPGSGSVFTVEWPAPRAQASTEPAKLAAEPGESTASAGRGLILVVEDNAINRKVITRQLASLGYDCEAVEDGRLGLDAWRTGRYALVLTDCQMPNMDGYDMTRAIRADEQSASMHTPIVALTANAMRGDVDKCMAAGMDDYLSKPCDVSDLGAKIENWLPGGSRGSPLAAAGSG